MERALEADHGLAPGVGPRELDGVLDRLGARVEEGGLGPGDRGQLGEPLGELDVDLVGDDREVGVREAGHLVLRRCDHLRVGVADVEAADAAGEVEVRVVVDVGQGRAATLGGDDGEVDRQRVRDNPVLPREDLAGTGPGDLGSELDRLGGGHASDLTRRRGRWRMDA